MYKNFESCKLTSSPQTWEMWHNIRKEMSNNMILVWAIFPISPWVCFANSLILQQKKQFVQVFLINVTKINRLYTSPFPIIMQLLFLDISKGCDFSADTLISTDLKVKTASLDISADPQLINISSFFFLSQSHPSFLTQIYQGDWTK